MSHPKSKFVNTADFSTRPLRRWALPLITAALGLGLSAPALAAAPLPPSDIQYQGPIVIKKGGTYSGNWESNDKTAAVYIQTTEPVIIENANIRGRGNLIAGFNADLTVRNTRGYNLNPDVAGKTAGRAISLEEFRSLNVMNSSFEGSTGIYLRHYKGAADQQNTIKIVGNQFKNIDGRQSDGNGGYTEKHDIEHAILLNAVQRVPNVEIAWNEVINVPGESRVEENFNIYASSGTPQSPMLIHDNYIQGAYPTATEMTSFAGGGIILGDGKVSDPLDSGYIKVFNNQIVGTTNNGLAIVGGVNNQMYDNRVLSSGLTPDGQRLPTTNVGVYLWDQYQGADLAAPTFANNQMENNTVGWTKVGVKGETTNNPYWFPSCGVQKTVCDGNQNLGTVTPAMEKAEYGRWQSKLAAANIKVGP